LERNRGLLGFFPGRGRERVPTPQGGPGRLGLFPGGGLEKKSGVRHRGL